MYTTKHTHAPCPVCESKVEGRIDKRYCALKCKNAHHYSSRRLNKPMTEIVNLQLLRNRTILEGIMQNGPNLLHINQVILIKLGFSLETVTGFKILGNSKVIHKCYQFSYSIDKNGIVKVTRHEEVNTFYPGFYERWVIDFPLKDSVNLTKGTEKSVHEPLEPD